MDILHWNMYCTEICIVLQTKSSMTYTWQGTDGMWYCSDYNTHVFCSPCMCLCTVLREMSMLILLTTHTTTAWGQKVTETNDKLFCGAAGALWCMSCKRLLPDCRLFYFVAVVVRFVGGGYRPHSRRPTANEQQRAITSRKNWNV